MSAIMSAWLRGWMTGEGRKSRKGRHRKTERTRLRGPRFSDGEATAAPKLSVFII